MAKYRNRLQIIAEILEIVKEGARKTHIMYQCNLSYKLLKRYLRDVLRFELVCTEGDCNGFIITEKGKQFLERFENYVERSQRISQQVEKVNCEKEILERMVSAK